MQKAKVVSIDWANSNTRQIEVLIDADKSEYVMESNNSGFPTLVNSATLLEGVNYVLEFGHNAIRAMKENTQFMDLAKENRELRQGIKKSDLAVRVRQLLSALDYGQLTDYQAKCVLLVEQQLKP